MNYYEFIKKKTKRKGVLDGKIERERSTVKANLKTMGEERMSRK